MTPVPPKWMVRGVDHFRSKQIIANFLYLYLYQEFSIFGNIWSYLVILGNIWSYLVIFGHIRSWIFYKFGKINFLKQGRVAVGWFLFWWKLKFQLLHGFKLFHFVHKFRNTFCFRCRTTPSAVCNFFLLQWENGRSVFCSDWLPL